MSETKIKHFQQVRELKKVERAAGQGESNEYCFVISDETPDRYNTIIPIDNWQLLNFNNNGIVAYQHETSSWGSTDPDRIIGKGRAEVVDGVLLGFVEFEPAEMNPFAEKIRQKIEFGTLKATSVGFQPTSSGHWGNPDDGEDEDVYYYGQVDLLEFSIVNIPANPNALKRSLEIEKALNEDAENPKHEKKEKEPVDNTRLNSAKLQVAKNQIRATELRNDVVVG